MKLYTIVIVCSAFFRLLEVTLAKAAVNTAAGQVKDSTKTTTSIHVNGTADEYIDADDDPPIRPAEDLTNTTHGTSTAFVSNATLTDDDVSFDVSTDVSTDVSGEEYGSKLLSDDDNAMTEDSTATPTTEDGSTISATTLKEEGFLTNRIIVVLAISIAAVVLILLIILICVCCRGGSGGPKSEAAAGDRGKPTPKKVPILLTTPTPMESDGDKGPKDETTPLPPPKINMPKKIVSKSESAEAPNGGSVDSKKEIASAATLNGKESKSEPFVKSSSKVPPKQMSFVEQQNIYKQLCDQFNPTPASSGSSS